MVPRQGPQIRAGRDIEGRVAVSGTKGNESIAISCLLMAAAVEMSVGIGRVQGWQVGGQVANITGDAAAGVIGQAYIEAKAVGHGAIILSVPLYNPATLVYRSCHGHRTGI